MRAWLPAFRPACLPEGLPAQRRPGAPGVHACGRPGTLGVPGGRAGPARAACAACQACEHARHAMQARPAWQGRHVRACLPAAPGRCPAYHGDELVVPLLLVVVHEAEKLADAHVVCLQGGGGVSSAEGTGSRYRPKGRSAIKRPTDFFFTSTTYNAEERRLAGHVMGPVEPDVRRATACIHSIQQ